MAWTLAAPLAELDGRDVIGVECAGRRVALYRLHDGIYATSDVCPHHGAALSQGTVVDGYIECPGHFALFDIRTGSADGSVTSHPVRIVPTRVDEGEVYVDLSGLEETPS